jgi:hypothetical protein
MAWGEGGTGPGTGATWPRQCAGADCVAWPSTRALLQRRSCLRAFTHTHVALYHTTLLAPECDDLVWRAPAAFDRQCKRAGLWALTHNPHTTHTHAWERPSFPPCIGPIVPLSAVGRAVGVRRGPLPFSRVVDVWAPLRVPRMRRGGRGTSPRRSRSRSRSRDRRDGDRDRDRDRDRERGRGRDRSPSPARRAAGASARRRGSPSSSPSPSTSPSPQRSAPRSGWSKERGSAPSASLIALRVPEGTTEAEVGAAWWCKASHAVTHALHARLARTPCMRMRSTPVVHTACTGPQMPMHSSAVLARTPCTRMRSTPVVHTACTAPQMPVHLSAVLPAPPPPFLLPPGGPPLPPQLRAALRPHVPSSVKILPDRLAAFVDFPSVAEAEAAVDAFGAPPPPGRVCALAACKSRSVGRCSCLVGCACGCVWVHGGWVVAPLQRVRQAPVGGTWWSTVLC